MSQLPRFIHTVVIKDGDQWFVKGVNVNYSCRASTIEDALQNFEKGFDSEFVAKRICWGDINRLCTPVKSDIDRVLNEIKLNEGWKKIAIKNGEAKREYLKEIESLKNCIDWLEGGEGHKSILESFNGGYDD